MNAPDPALVPLNRREAGFLADLVGGTGRSLWGDVAAHHGLSSDEIRALWERLETATVDERGHKPVTCTRTDCPGCQFCAGGLYGCSVCGGLEGSMPSTCPGTTMTTTQLDEVYAGRLDFRDGLWVTACSPSSPAKWRDGHWELRDGDTVVSQHPSFREAVRAGEGHGDRLLTVHDNDGDLVGYMRDGRIFDEEPGQ